VQRFRRRRRRIAAAALLPIAAIYMTTPLASSAASEDKTARIDASRASVELGDSVVLHGTFPGANKAPFEVRYRAKGGKRWHTASHARTGASGRYGVRVKPRRSGYWRAQLAAEPQAATGEDATPSAPAAVDRGTGSERVSVRSQTRTSVNGREALVGRTVKVRGTVSPAGAKRRVLVRIGDDEQVTRAGRDGKFAISWKAPSTGSYPVRVTARSNRTATGSRDSAGKITAYRQAVASWYGPGLYGNALACGGTLTPSTIGVAHKTMPCGTKLRLRYGNRSVDVRVIDRGPFSGSREFDLTSATKQALGFPDVGTVLTSR
jgi:hypothetical protein